MKKSFKTLFGSRMALTVRKNRIPLVIEKIDQFWILVPKCHQKVAKRWFYLEE